MSRIVTGGGERFEALMFSDKVLEIVHPSLKKPPYTGVLLPVQRNVGMKADVAGLKARSTNYGMGRRLL
jgi:hypothetical protein